MASSSMILQSFGIAKCDYNAQLQDEENVKQSLDRSLDYIGKQINDEVDDTDTRAYLEMAGVNNDNIEKVVEIHHGFMRHRTISRIMKLIQTATRSLGHQLYPSIRATCAKSSKSTSNLLDLKSTV